MSYESICTENKLLYGELEKLSVQIKAYTEAEMENKVVDLKRKKNGIKRLIDINLDLIEEIWEYENKTVRTYTSKNTILVPTKLDLKVIALYKTNPNLTGRELADKLRMNTYSVSTILTRYLNNQYKLTA